MTNSRWYLFVSTHLDDAILSCGGYIYRLAKAGERVAIATLVTADLPLGETMSWPARRAYLTWGVGRTPFACRRAEDEAAARSLGASCIHLGLKDAMYRRDDCGRWLYPASTVGGVVASYDHDHFEIDVREKLKGILSSYSGDVQLFCPLGAGGHVDHLIVRRSVEAVSESASIIYYEDYPYSGHRGALASTVAGDEVPPMYSATSALSQLEIEARVKATSCYVSQLPGLFPSSLDRTVSILLTRLPFLTRFMEFPSCNDSCIQRMSASLHKYIVDVGGERYWQRGEEPQLVTTLCEEVAW